MFLRYLARRHPLPVTAANADRSPPVAAALELVDRTGLRPIAKRAQAALKRLRWRHAYASDPMQWFALVDRDEFRRRYTGRETGHSFFALQSLRAAAR